MHNQNIICFAGEDWWYHNPHSNLHIMKSFAKSNRVLFVNSIGTRMPDFKSDKFAMKKVFNKLKSMLRYLKRAEENIYVLTPVAVPYIKGFEDVVGVINKYLLYFQVLIIMKVLKFKNPIFWVCAPTFKDVAIRLKSFGKCLVYYCVDNISYMGGGLNKYIQDLDFALQKAADVTFFVNHRLVAERKLLNEFTYHLGHGVDYDHFARCQEASVEIPDDIINIPLPILGYIGVLHGVDFSLVRYLAQKNVGVSFVFIGDMCPDLSLSALSNVYFLGKKSYESLPSYMKRMSCLGIFYEPNNVFNKYRNPKKLLEYLASGKPIISIQILELEQFRDLLYLGDNYEEINKCLIMALNEDASKKNERMEYARRHTWDDVRREAEKHILSAIDRRKALIKGKNDGTSICAE